MKEIWNDCPLCCAPMEAKYGSDGRLHLIACVQCNNYTIAAYDDNIDEEFMSGVAEKKSYQYSRLNSDVLITIYTYPEIKLTLDATTSWQSIPKIIKNYMLLL